MESVHSDSLENSNLSFNLQWHRQKKTNQDMGEKAEQIFEKSMEHNKETEYVFDSDETLEYELIEKKNFSIETRPNENSQEYDKYNTIDSHTRHKDTLYDLFLASDAEIYHNENENGNRNKYEKPHQFENSEFFRKCLKSDIYIKTQSCYSSQEKKRIETSETYTDKQNIYMNRSESENHIHNPYTSEQSEIDNYMATNSFWDSLSEIRHVHYKDVSEKDYETNEKKTSFIDDPKHGKYDYRHIRMSNGVKTTANIVDCPEFHFKSEINKANPSNITKEPKTDIKEEIDLIESKKTQDNGINFVDVMINSELHHSKLNRVIEHADCEYKNKNSKEITAHSTAFSYNEGFLKEETNKKCMVETKGNQTIEHARPSLQKEELPKYDSTINKEAQNELRKQLLDNTNCHWTLQKGRNILSGHRIKIETMKRSFSLPVQQFHGHKELCYENFWQSIDNGVKFSLPIRKISKSDSLPRILSTDLAYCLENMRNIRIIDCRFEYEYIGGHIKNAINIDTTDLLTHKLTEFGNNILIFYCEFSSVRAPKIAKFLRNYDRFNNEYPKLDFPEIYVLDGGYKNFYTQHPDLCVPRNYVPMNS